MSPLIPLTSSKLARLIENIYYEALTSLPINDAASFHPLCCVFSIVSLDESITGGTCSQSNWQQKPWSPIQSKTRARLVRYNDWKIIKQIKSSRKSFSILPDSSSSLASPDSAHLLPRSALQRKTWLGYFPCAQKYFSTKHSIETLILVMHRHLLFHPLDGKLFCFCVRAYIILSKSKIINYVTLFDSKP